MRKRVVAHAIEGNKEYRLDLSRYGVRPDWSAGPIWDVAKREMMIHFEKQPTCWGIEEY